jgi:hypothetical protein
MLANFHTVTIRCGTVCGHYNSLHCLALSLTLRYGKRMRLRFCCVQNLAKFRTVTIRCGTVCGHYNSFHCLTQSLTLRYGKRIRLRFCYVHYNPGFSLTWWGKNVFLQPPRGWHSVTANLNLLTAINRNEAS